MTKRDKYLLRILTQADLVLEAADTDKANGLSRAGVQTVRDKLHDALSVVTKERVVL